MYECCKKLNEKEKPDLKKRKFSPPQILVLGFTFIIAIGTFLLMLPISIHQEGRLSFIDALFTATSATCVTGLAVKDTGTFFTPFGQIVILALVQVGGLGFMTMATLFSLVLKRRISLKDRLLLQQAMNQNTMEGIVRLIRKVIVYSIIIEGTAALALTLRWAMEMPFRQAVYYGVFHAVSLFNNAGFDLLGNFQSLTQHVSDPIINLISMVLIISGGIGFIVISDLVDYRKNRGLSLHSKVVLSMSGALIVIGAIVIFVFEFTNPQTLEPLSLEGKIWSSLFQSITPRSGGVVTVDIASMRQATQFFIIVLMFIGAAPGSTGGGIKVTTFAILIGAMFSMIRGRDDIVMFRYRIVQERIVKALTITLLTLFLLIFIAMVLSTTESANFLSILFETTSAFSTVGLSMGLTTNLTVFGKIVICITMFIGRLGPLTLAYALGPKKGRELYRHPEGQMIIG
ncbi:TrkH family potassium uptake protein [Paenibacillus physcomitrellae]|uniref:TrkH family potassium uptake protein n=1 Tax=Paenibacillus physcomitrellae TaxID=1619311 RepID=UPI000B8C85A2|nr:TrkH family potassium uptake protein [Paenibacillus physcomitrellae]